MVFGAIIALGLYGLLSVVSPGPAADQPRSTWDYDFLRTAVVAAGILTAAGAAAVPFRRQQTLESSHLLDKAKQDREVRADLHAQYQQAVAQLGHENAMVRTAGIYAIEELAHEWAAVEGTTAGGGQSDVCIDLLCGYLHARPKKEAFFDDDKPTGYEFVGQEGKVRNTILTVIRRNLHDPKDITRPSRWSHH